MKKIVVMLFSLIAIQAIGQNNIDYNKIILPDYVKDADFGEKLVQLAWRNNPGNDVFKQRITMAKLDTWRYKADWLNFINLQSNINEYTIRKADNLINGKDSTAPGFYPLYNIRLSVNLGNIFTIPFDVRKSKILQTIAVSDLNSQKIAIRTAVLKAYNDFLLREKTYKIQTQMLSDTESSHKLVEQKFKNGETTFETYVSSLNNTNRLSIDILEAENDYKNAKLDVEQFIGMKLEEVR